MERTHSYDTIIIGFGKGGKTIAPKLAASGKKVAVIEKSPKMYGGTCINVACIPTKFLVTNAMKISQMKGGWEEKAPAYREVMDKKAVLIAKMNRKNYESLAGNDNIDVIDGTARFIAPHRIEVEGQNGRMEMEAPQIIINTGAVPVVPPIPGLKENPYVYVSETMLDLKELPKRLAIIGAGYIGIEFASIYRHFGSQVTVLQDGDAFLPREDAEVAAAVRAQLEKQGIVIRTGVKVLETATKDGYAEVVIEAENKEERLPADAVLVATGRKPATSLLNLEAAGIKTDARGGIITDEYRMTSTEGVYAIGDVAGGRQFTYLSLDDYRIVASKLLGDGGYSLNERGQIPYSTFIEPPFSRVGMTEEEAKKAGYQVKVGRLAASAIPKSMILSQADGLLKAVVDAQSGQILGAHLFCEESHEMINLIKMAMDAKLPYTVIRDMIFTHPSMSESLNTLFSI